MRFLYVSLFALLFFVLHITPNAKAQITQPRKTFSAGAAQSSGGNYSNFGVVGQAMTSARRTGGDYTANEGFIYGPPNPTLDSAILAHLYLTTDGPNWDINWNLSQPWHTWYGVTTIGQSLVRLELPNNNLSGAIPTRFTHPNDTLVMENLSLVEAVEINIAENFLDFRSCEPLVGLVSDPTFLYAPQGKILDPIDTTVVEGSSYTLKCNTQGMALNFQWRKEGIDIPNATDSLLTLQNLTLADTGYYTCIVTSDIAQDLVLQRHDIHLNVAGYPTASDSLALVALFDSTGGTTTWSDPWNLFQPVNTWHGVTLTGDKVTSLDLSSEGLTGFLPEVFDNELFSELWYLSFFDNQLTGPIPESLGNITTLRYLDLEKNQLEGAVPVSFGNLVNLKSLWLSRNLLETLPAELGNLTSLENLFLRNNQFTSLPATLENVPLRVLDISANLFVDFPAVIPEMVNLRKLYASQNQISVLPEELSNLTRLETFEVAENRLPHLPVALQRLLNLEQLNVAQNALEFDDLLPLVGQPSQFSYAPQAKINTSYDTLVPVNQSVTLLTETPGSGNQYLWAKDGSPLATETQSAIRLVSSVRTKGTYTCEVTNPSVPGLTLYRRPVRLRPSCAGSITARIVSEEDPVACAGSPFSLQLRLETDAQNPEIQWYLNGDPIFLAEDTTHWATQTGTYYVEVRENSFCSVISDSLTIVANPSPEVEIAATGTLLESTITAGQAAFYQWFRDGAAISGANSDTYNARQSGTYSLQVLDSLGCVGTSNPIILSVTALEDEGENEPWAAYPNPAQRTLYVKLNRFGETPTFVLRDVLGRVLPTPVFEEIQPGIYRLNLSKLPVGQYVLEASQDKRTQSFKLMRE